MRLNNRELDEAVAVLGLVPRDFVALQQSRDAVEARDILKLVKDKARRGFRKAALRLHPDHNGGDESKTQLFIRAKAALDHIEQLEIRQPKPVRRPLMRVVYYGTPFTSSTSTSTYTGGFGTSYTTTMVI